jgi:hypothetical protein
MTSLAKNSISAFDKSLSKENSQYYGLSIQCAPDGFSFTIFDPRNKKFLGIGHYDFQYASNFHLLNNTLSGLIPQIDLLDRQYESVRIIFETHKSSLVPNAFFDPENMPACISLHHRTAPGEILQSDYLPILDSRNIWLMPENVLNTLRAFFPMAALHNHGSVLIESLLALNKNRDEGHGVFVYVRKNMFDIVVLNGNKLLFFNSFRYQAKEDFIYFLIYVLEQLEINPESVQLTFLGEIVKLSTIYDITHKYVRNVAFGSRSEEFNFSYVFDDLPGHFYFNLLNHYRCEL